MTKLADFSATTLAGEERSLADFDGSVALVVNTASKCGFTPQYAGLQQLFDSYRDKGFTVLGFPSNEFAGQEPGASGDIEEFCQVNYGVSFPMFEKIKVNGKNAHPLYQWLKTEKGGILGDAIKWNFTKFLIGRDGQVVKRYASNVDPADIAADIETALAA
ncbi:glutathione peroxidase [Agrococcus casei]|uniref:Glutathione peroxidase n=1 Tax=Agrococcus casei LMG 22410 TaxID=1255656 RepID=A0A1R4F1T4_9MICO|nr:glutathione peroxidase [Agrococcus casei]SJM49783.1 Glutathione peroxidase family protein [Agrococcus casei LMG 22410]